MVDYILDDFGDRDLWTLVNSTWDYLVGGGGWRIHHDAVGGYGEKEVTTYNIDWWLSVEHYVEILPSNENIADIMVYLDGDPNPIIFRLLYGPGGPSYPRTYSIIYNGDVKDSIIVTSGIPPFNSTIRRVGSIYYWLSAYNLTFDYGSELKPVKIRLTNATCDFDTRWFDPDWYYTEPLPGEVGESYGFIL